jgi:hypothetical protein
MIAFGFEGSAAVRAGRAPIEKRLHLVVQQAFLDRGEELFGLPECQAQMLDALRVLLQGNDVSNGFFLAIIAAHDELEFDAHGRAPPGLIGRCMMQAILPEFIDYPQHLHALHAFLPDTKEVRILSDVLSPTNPAMSKTHMAEHVR